MAKVHQAAKEIRRAIVCLEGRRGTEEAIGMKEAKKDGSGEGRNSGMKEKG